MALVATLSGRSSGWFSSVEHHDELDSSNTELLRRHAAGEDVVGRAILVEHQTAGRGRQGRTWHDDGASTLMVSVGLRVPSSVATLVPLAVGLGVADTVGSLLDEASSTPGSRPGLKWPNDVEIAGRKVAGILVEAAEIDPSGDAILVAGMGINLGWSGEPPAEILERLTTIERATGRRIRPVDAVGGLVDRLAVAFDELVSDRSEHLARYRARCVSIGRSVRLATPAGDVVGTVVGVADDGALLVRRPDGGVDAHTAGDVHHRS